MAATEAQAEGAATAAADNVVAPAQPTKAAAAPPDELDQVAEDEDEALLISPAAVAPRGGPGRSSRPGGGRSRGGIKRKMALRRVSVGEDQEPIVEEVDDVESPCTCCGGETYDGERIQAGKPESPIWWHVWCKTSHEALERCAKAKDRAISKVETKHLKAYRELRDTNKTMWALKVLMNCCGEGERRNSKHREQAAGIIDSVVQFSRAFTQVGQILLPERPFKQYYKREWGYDSDEAESEWQAAKSNPNVYSETDVHFGLCCAVRQFKQFIGQHGAERNRALAQKKTCGDSGRDGCCPAADSAAFGS